MTDRDNAPRPTAPRRRQARGQKRIDDILAAAARVFGEYGYEGATTNRIAAEAGISPGSLYQFFTNKDEIAGALAQRYADELKSVQSDAFASVERLPIAAAVKQVVGPLVAFNRAHPGFKALFARTDMPAGLTAAVAPVQAAFHHRIRTIVAAYMSSAGADEVARVATMAMQIVRGSMPLIVDASEQERSKLVVELETALATYLEAAATR